jgi:hypothetical protein
VTSTGGKESEMKVKEMNFNIEHKKEQRRILDQDMVNFYGHNS